MTAELEEKIKTSLVDGGIPCLTAWEVASEMQVGRRQLGDTLNAMSIRVHDCQLGCFDLKKATHTDLVGKEVNPVIAEKVGASLVDGHLPCPVAFKVVETLQVTPREVGDAATLQKTKINKCQLGCFP